MTPCVWRILCLRNSSWSVSYFRQPPNLPTAARRNRKCTECGTTAFGRNRMSARSAHLSTFGAETETKAEIRLTSSFYTVTLQVKTFLSHNWRVENENQLSATFRVLRKRRLKFRYNFSSKHRNWMKPCQHNHEMQIYIAMFFVLRFFREKY